jgi:translation elongation factor EF-Tu-like GTPase
VGAAAEQFRFKVDYIFTIINRGTAIMGFIDQWIVHVGDKLQTIREEGTAGPEITCPGIESDRTQTGARRASTHRAARRRPTQT